MERFSVDLGSAKAVLHVTRAATMLSCRQL
jgi:hypothetical protein